MSESRRRSTPVLVAALFAVPLMASIVFPVSLAASTPPAMGDWVVAEDTVITAPVTIHGNVTVSAGKALTFNGAILYMADDATWIHLMDGASLRFNGGSLQDNQNDPDDGSAQDWTYAVVLDTEATFELTGATWQGSSGLTASDAVVRMVDSTVKMHRGPIELYLASNLRATNTTFTQNVAPLFFLRETAMAEVAGKGVPTYDVGPAASLSYSSFLWVKVNDTSGKPLIGAEWGVETSAGLVAGSKMMGGMQPTTRLDMEGHPVPVWVKAPYLQVMGASTSLAGVIVRARVAEWSDARFVNTSMDSNVSFTAMNRGVVLEDASTQAMLDVYHGMDMMGGMGMGDMGGNLSMGANMSMGGGMTMGGGMSMDGREMMGPMMTQGPGSAWGDFNGDGHVDVVVTAAPETDEMMLMDMNLSVTDYPAPVLFLGMGDGMFQMEPMSGLETAAGAQGVSAGDFNGDGALDLFVARYGNVGTAMEDAQMHMTFKDGKPLTSMIFENDGHGMFMDATAMVGFTMPARYTTGGIWNDYNRDGCLDLYVVNMGQMATAMMEGASSSDMMMMDMAMNFVKPQANYLFKNDCNGRLTDVTAAAGSPTGGLAPGGETDWQSLVMDPVQRYWYASSTGRDLSGSGVSYTAAFFDADEDGWPDLLVGNDFGISPLYHNNGDGTFTQRTAASGFDKIGSAMGFAVADFNRDNHLDVFQSNFNEDYLWMANGDGTFTERAQAYGVDDMAVGWGVGAPDLNNDGWPDLAISTGYMSMMMKASERSSVYINGGGTRFWDGSAGSGIDKDPALGISLATADVDEDGKLDLFLGKTTGMNKLYLNREGGGSHLRIDLHGIDSNSYGVGAEVTAMVGGLPFRAVVQPGGEYASSNEPGVFIGLGAQMEAKSVMVKWPSGILQPLGDLMAGSRTTARELVQAHVDAGPDGTANTTVPVELMGTVMGAELTGGHYAWTFHGPAGAQTVEGKDAMFTPNAPGVYTAEFTVKDRFGADFGSDFCVMTVTDTSVPKINVTMPATITASGKPVFDASGTTDNDPAFKVGGIYEWTFRNGALEFKATGVKPTVQLPKAGIWNITLKVTDPSNNSISQSFDAKVTGAGPASVTQDMVVLAIAATTISILGVAILSSRVWRRPEDELAPEHFSELQPHEIVVADEAGSDAPPFPFRPDRKEEEE